jgi:hypothetical protein
LSKEIVPQKKLSNQEFFLFFPLFFPLSFSQKTLPNFWLKLFGEKWKKIKKITFTKVFSVGTSVWKMLCFVS